MLRGGDVFPAIAFAIGFRYFIIPMMISHFAEDFAAEPLLPVVAWILIIDGMLSVAWFARYEFFASGLTGQIQQA